jgi:hypothetical protein
MVKPNREFDNFDSTMRKLLAIPHSEIKAKLDAEKAEKAKRPKKRGRPLGSSASSGRASGDKD